MEEAQSCLTEVVLLVLHLFQLSLHQMNRGLPALVFLGQVSGALLLLLLHLLLKLLDFCLPALVVLILCLVRLALKFLSKVFLLLSDLFYFGLHQTGLGFPAQVFFGQLWCCSARSSENFCSCSLIWSLSCLTSVSQLFFSWPNDYFASAPVFFSQVFGELFLLLSHLVFQLFDIRLPAFVVLCQIIVLLLPVLIWPPPVLIWPPPFGLHRLLVFRDLFSLLFQLVHQLLDFLLQERRIFPPRLSHTQEFISSHHEQFDGLCVKLQETLIVLAVVCLLVALV
ncbi:hypothetical protein F7725_010206 [Dissostichus mawsoni]|uniref:Uncharacterized protein n=1 Tax=Dissostichus mawsoni TaxID=36200 RepID=A0A7J5XQV8_DISMA|nr:hypothetical protein F7725_010206 [Dissostichus mawsoni]